MHAFDHTGGNNIQNLVNNRLDSSAALMEHDVGLPQLSSTSSHAAFGVPDTSAMTSVVNAASGFAPLLDLANLGVANGFEILGAAAGDRSGSSVASAGDINGDGFADLIIGAPRADVNATDDGASYIVFGSAHGFGTELDLASLDGSNGFTLAGPTKLGYGASSVASAGDVNGDGFDDFLIGSPTVKYSDHTGFVVFGHGGTFGSTFDLSTLDGTNGFSISDTALTDGSGQDMAPAGDMNGDGFADFIVGARHTGERDLSSRGSAFVVFGHGGTFDANIGLSTLNGTDGFKIAGADKGDLAGRSVASAGDINGDGFADVIVGAPYAKPDGHNIEGAAYVVFGHTGTFDTIDLGKLDGTDGFAIVGGATHTHIGWSVGSAGDINGDGFADIIVSEPTAGTSGAALHSGASYVVFGHSGGFGASVNVDTLNGHNGFTISGAATQDQSGYSVASAGDVNGDGFGDLIIGSGGGHNYVVFGHAGGFAANIDLSTLDGSNGFEVFHDAATPYSGHYVVSSGGDINGDGFGDLIVGAPYDSGPGGGAEYGISYVIYGQAPDEAVVRKGSAVGQTISGGAFDDKLSGFGGDDTLNGNDGNDVLNGGGGKDTLQAGAGNDHLNGGSGKDVLHGNAGADVLFGGSGADQLAGGGGADTFEYTAVGQSTGVAHDRIIGLNFAADHFDMGFSVSAVDAAVTSGALSQTSFDADLAGAIGETQLGSHHAVLFTASAGSLAGHVFLIVDANGVAGYQSGHDYVFDVTGATHIADLSAATFV